MKILHLNFNDIGGGAGIGAYRLHKELLRKGVDSQFWACRKQSDDPSVKIAPNIIAFKKQPVNARILIHSALQRLYRFKGQSEGLKTPSFPFPSQISHYINRQNPDVVHLHWVQNGFVTIQDINKINAPVFITTADMWALTDGAHYVEDDSWSYNTEKINSTWAKKKKIFEAKKVSLVCPSQWMVDSVCRSPITKNLQTNLIHYGIPLAVFKSLDKATLRYKWGLPIDKTLLFFGAVSATTDPRKGFNFIEHLLKNLNPGKFHCVVLGNRGHSNRLDNSNMSFMGHVYDPHAMAELYSASDIAVVPSRQETFCMVAAESMACGRPVVCFDTSGLKDVVSHLETGYRAKCFNQDDLLKGVEWCCEQIKKNKNLEKICRQRVEQNFDIRQTAQKHLLFYRKILESHQ